MDAALMPRSSAISRIVIPSASMSATLARLTTPRGRPFTRPCRRAFSRPANRALTQPNAFLFGDGRKDAQHGVFEDPARVEVLLSETPIADAIGRQALKVIQRLQNSLTAETIKAPKENRIELAL
jgi:hypothetical protein